MARSSRGEDARFSFWKQGFDSPTGYETAAKAERFFFISFNTAKLKVGIFFKNTLECGVEQLVARRAHNPKVARSSRVPATNSVGSSQLAILIAYWKFKTEKWPVRLGVRTPDFHSGNRGSIPLRATIPLYNK